MIDTTSASIGQLSNLDLSIIKNSIPAPSNYFENVCFDFESLNNIFIGNSDEGKLKANRKNIDKTMCMLAVKFMKFLIRNTFKQQLVFDIKAGRVYRRVIKEVDRKQGSKFWKIQDPFIKEFNYGTEFHIRGELRSAENNPKQRLKHMLAEMKALIYAVKERKVEEWMYPESNTEAPSIVWSLLENI